MAEGLAGPITRAMFLRLLLATVTKHDTKADLCDFIGLIDLRIQRGAEGGLTRAECAAVEGQI